MEARESEGRALRTGKKEPADSWSRRDPHRAINLDRFAAILSFGPGSFRESSLSHVQSSTTVRKIFPSLRLFPSIVRLNLESKLLTAKHPARQTAMWQFNYFSR